MKTLWQQHQERWRNGCGSELCSKKHTRVCLGRGTLPCDILFIGEAPGEGENVIGKPFVGPAGKLLDHIIDKSIGRFKDPVTKENIYTYALTNIVGCIPREEDGAKAGQPPPEAIESCQERLKEFIEIANPRFIVTVGKYAREGMEQGYRHSIKLHRDIPQIHIVHPAAILRQNVAHQGLLVQRAFVTIRNAIEEIAVQS